MTTHSSEGAGSWYVLRVKRYFLAGIGPITLAGTHFVISFAMLRLDEPAAFGVFTFLFVAAQFTVALSGALFGAPLQSLPAAHQEGDSGAQAASIVTAALAMAIVAGIMFTLLSWAAGLWRTAALWYGLYTATMILRWVGRAWSYAADRPFRVAVSDLLYGGVALSIFGFGAYFLEMVPESACYSALATGSAISLLAFGRSYAALLLARPSRRAVYVYRSIWRSQSRWALLGVAATEAVANVHIYMVTLVAGPTAVAPLAAATLLLRPINVVQNALIDFERPQMSALIASRSFTELRRTMRLFLAVLLLAWIASSMLALGVVWLVPALVFSPEYDLDVVRLATIFWVAVALLILLQVPSSVMLQARGDFEPLARATVWSSLVSVTAVVAALVIFGPVWTIAAMVLGWSVDLALVKRAAARRWRLLDTGAV